MKINFSQLVYSIDRTPFTKTNTKTGQEEPATLAQLCSEALLSMFSDEVQLPGDEKFARYNSATKVHSGGEVDVSAEEITKMKICVGKLYGPSAVGPIYNALEGRTSNESVK